MVLWLQCNGDGGDGQAHLAMSDMVFPVPVIKARTSKELCSEGERGGGDILACQE